MKTAWGLILVGALLACSAWAGTAKPWDHGRLMVAPNHRYLQLADGTPFFWLGDTAWHLFDKLNRDEVETYLEDRREKGFDVIQVVVATRPLQRNVYGQPAFVDGDVTRPLIDAGGDYWTNIDFVLDAAAQKGIYLAMLPVWGFMVKSGAVDVEKAKTYATWLAERYRGKPNLVWINGGDVKGSDKPEVWLALGQALRQSDPNHLITFHPFGGTESSAWFQNEAWLDFNMFQSGHRRYDQVREDQGAAWKGEDNWRYVAEDLAKNPPKPTLDGEPSYENIPQGLHDLTQPYWEAKDCRRYAYWSVFAGALGHTYGDNAVMQMFKPGQGRGGFGVSNYWFEAIHDPGSGQMQYLKRLILSRPFFERIPDQSVIAGANGQRYERVIATRGASYLFAYTYTGRPFEIALGKISGAVLDAWWYNPRDGSAQSIGKLSNQGTKQFDPPGTPADGNDWVLVLDDASKNYPAPGGDPPASAAETPAQRLARWKPVKMPFDSAGLTARERQEVEKLVEACRLLNDVYWRQSDLDGLALYQKTNNPTLKSLLSIMGSRWDLLDENRPFVGETPMPPGHELYPHDLTRAQVEQYVKAHPADKSAIYDPYTVVKRQGGRLVATPYHVEYAEFVKPMAAALREAAALTPDAAFANFLRLRADALLTDDYYQSDLAWLDLKDPKIDVIFAPYETYLDGLLGVKTSYGASVLIRNQPESRKLAAFQKYVPDIQDALPLDAADRPSKRGLATPMEVMDAPYRAGDLRYGYQAVADNLPNDPRIHQQKGSKKIFFKNFMDARVNYVILPLAKKLMQPAQAEKVSGDGSLTWTLMHEISHGLGPAYSRVGGKQVDTREAIGPTYSGLEEAKADVVGMFGLEWLINHGALPKARREEYYASYVAGIFRTLRFGTGEAHGRAEMMEFNYLVENRALARDAAGLYAIDYTRIAPVLARLAKELLVIEATGDRARAEAWFAKYDKMPAVLENALSATAGIPVDVQPIFSFADEVR